MRKGQTVKFRFGDKRILIEGRIIKIDNNFVTIEDKDGQMAYNVRGIQQVAILKQPDARVLGPLK